MTREVLARYDLDGEVVSCERHGHGHINETYLAVTEHGRRYILQKINQPVFRDVDALMSNIEAVTAWLRRRSADPREVLHLVRSKTGQELELLPMGARLMTLECGIRFLTDYLDGDHYFATRREGHNLDRCRTQFKLAADMEKKWEQMQKIVKEAAG